MDREVAKVLLTAVNSFLAVLIKPFEGKYDGRVPSAQFLEELESYFQQNNILEERKLGIAVGALTDLAKSRYDALRDCGLINDFASFKTYFLKFFPETLYTSATEEYYESGIQEYEQEIDECKDGIEEYKDGGEYVEGVSRWAKAWGNIKLNSVTVREPEHSLSPVTDSTGLKLYDILVVSENDEYEDDDQPLEEDEDYEVPIVTPQWTNEEKSDESVPESEWQVPVLEDGYLDFLFCDEEEKEKLETDADSSVQSTEAKETGKEEHGEWVEEAVEAEPAESDGVPVRASDETRFDIRRSVPEEPPPKKARSTSRQFTPAGKVDDTSRNAPPPHHHSKLDTRKWKGVRKRRPPPNNDRPKQDVHPGKRKRRPPPWSSRKFKTKLGRKESTPQAPPVTPRTSPEGLSWRQQINDKRGKISYFFLAPGYPRRKKKRGWIHYGNGKEQQISTTKFGVLNFVSSFKT